MPGFEVIDEKEKKAISRIFDEGKVFFAHGFDKKRKHYHVREFEQKLKNIFSPKMADVLCVSSGTAAIKVALKALGIGRGDEVITQSFNFIATVEAIVDTGANVVFTDIDDTLNMCPKNLESLISKKTKAIIPVHMLGVPADMTLINRIGKRNKKLKVKENDFGSGALWKFSQSVGSARYGAVTHPGALKEKKTYSDI